MLKPAVFQQPYVALRNIPYQLGSPEDRDHLQGGVLCQGQTVWRKFSAVPDHKTRAEAAFVEGVGVVSLNPHWLIPAVMLQGNKENQHGGY